MNKTIYVRDEDVAIWERAKELSGEKLSQVIVAGLRRFIAEKEAEAAENKGYERIVVEFNDANEYFLPKKKAFYGRWIISPNEPLKHVHEDGDEQDTYRVAETIKGGAVIFCTNDNREGYTSSQFLYYPSFEEAAANPDVNAAIRTAIEKRGVRVEELDI